jgi:hypothetical protein
MRRYPDSAERPGRLAATIITVAVSAALASCSSGSGGGPTSSSQPSPKPSASQSQPPGSGAVGISPNGVTTSVDAPAESTEDEYFHACLAAKQWMAQQPGDQKAQFEPYLAMLQSGAPPGPGTFNTPWAQLPPARQAAVVVAAQAAADSLCG